MPATPIRHLRIPEDIWAAVKARAAAEHTTATAFVVAAILRHLNRK